MSNPKPPKPVEEGEVIDLGEEAPDSWQDVASMHESEGSNTVYPVEEIREKKDLIFKKLTTVSNNKKDLRLEGRMLRKVFTTQNINTSLGRE